MVKLFSTEHTFAHPFHRVTSAFWKKYPNEQSPHVQAIDCYDRKIIQIPTATTATATTTTSNITRTTTTVDRKEDIIEEASIAPPSADEVETSPTPSFTPLLVTNRIISCYSPLPSWLHRCGVGDHAYAIETTVVNPTTQEMIVKSRNVTGNSLLVMEETCRYRPSLSNPQHTDYSQQAVITAFLPLFASKFEQFTVANVQRKSREGLQTIEQLCQRLQREGAASLFN